MDSFTKCLSGANFVDWFDTNVSARLTLKLCFRPASIRSWSLLGVVTSFVSKSIHCWSHAMALAPYLLKPDNNLGVILIPILQGNHSQRERHTSHLWRVKMPGLIRITSAIRIPHSLYAQMSYYLNEIICNCRKDFKKNFEIFLTISFYFQM